MPDTTLTWQPDEGLVPSPTPAGRLYAADSWLVQDGQARGLDLHRRRFTAACADVGVPESRVAPFWSAALRRLPTQGDWFPRVELTDNRLRLRIRPAPRRGTEIRVWLPNQPDPRRVPRHKGPDLPVLGELRDVAQDNGADDALLVRSDGTVLESGTSGLLWWDGERLCVPDPALPVLPSVTAHLIRDRAIRSGIDLQPCRSPVTDLAGHETWLVNALHGIRPVVAWRGVAITPGTPDRAPAWRRWWNDLAEPVQPS
jgi:branched-subunit amino acid aminotransferase/4-amino-4-deoxychorismate lyase